MTGKKIALRESNVQEIPVDQISVLNTRSRDEATYQEIEDNIRILGLKKPITVTPRAGTHPSAQYLLVCGEGRLRAFRALGQATIPAQVIEVSDEDAFVMGLAENFARRHYRPLELVAAIARMRDQGLTANEISRMTGIGTAHTKGLIGLIANGEDRLLATVEAGKLPIYAAIAVAKGGQTGGDKDINRALADALEAGQLKPSEVTEAKRIALMRRDLGKSLSRSNPGKPAITSIALVRTYRQQIARQQLMVKNATLAEQRLLFISGALSQLFLDEHFTAILKAEDLASLPDYLAQRLEAGGALL